MPVREMREFAELVREGDHTIPPRITLLEVHAERVRQRIRELSEQLEAVDHKVAYYRNVLAQPTRRKDR